ncbi:MAG: sigma-70 family RNA polymerase sigma factor [Polyangiales bacterium]
MSTLITMLGMLAVAAVTVGPDLVERIARGQADALRSAYDAHARRVFALALRIVRSREEAEDIVQDTFLELWRRAREFDPARGELSAWITSIARSRCIDRVRRAKVRARYATERAASDDGFDMRPSAPDERAARDQDGRRVRELLLGLPGEQRRALELAYFEGLTQQQIAQRTDTPLGTVKTRLRLAMEKLAPALEAMR